MKLYLRSIALVLFISSCAGSKKASRMHTLPELTVNASDSKYRATATLDWDITHTDVAISFNLPDKTAHGIATLDMHPYFYNSDKIVLDAKSMQINSVQVNNADARVNYQHDSLIIYLDRSYHHTESIQVKIDYAAMPYATPTGGSAAIRDDRGLYFINADNTVPNKPVQIWTQGETESNSHWVPTKDKPNERFTTTIHMNVPDSMTTLSNGLLKNSEQHEDGTRTDTWVNDKAIQPYVMMMAVGRFDIVNDEPYKDKAINYYVEPAFAPYAKDIFRNTPEMVSYFSDITGISFPWDKYSQVVVRDYVSGAMENTSASVFGEFVNQTSREILDKDYEDVVSHELFHQWFGDYVTAESWSNLTLNESFANYGEQLWRKHKYGQASAEQLGLQDLMTYLNQTRSNDAPLVRFHYRSREDLFDRISYQKGGAILHYLHGLMGDSAFYASMHYYLSHNALHPAEAHNWRMAIEAVTGKDWNWFFNQWYYKGGHPVLDISYKFDDEKKQVIVTMEQQQDEVYRLPMRIDVITGDHIFSDTIEMKAHTSTITYPYYGSQRPAVIPDALHWIVGEINDNKTPEHWLAHYKAAGKEEYTTKLQALRATAKKMSDNDVQDIYRAAINDHLEKIREYALATLQREKSNKVQDLFKSDIQFLAKEDPSNHVRAAANRVLGEWNIKDALPELYKALNDTSYKVEASALEAISRIDKDTAYPLARHLYDTHPGGTLRTYVWHLMGKEGNPDDTSLIIKDQYNFSGRDRMLFADALGDYMESTPSDSAFKVALDAVEFMVLTENISVYRKSIASYIFDQGYFYKKEISAASKKADVSKASNRLNMVRKAIIRIKEDEKDKKTQEEYTKYETEIFGK